MKYFIFTIAVLEALIIAFLAVQLSERGFGNKDMGYAYRSGCMLGQLYASSEKFSCKASSESYKDYLDFLDEKFEQQNKR